MSIRDLDFFRKIRFASTNIVYYQVVISKEVYFTSFNKLIGKVSKYFLRKH